MTFTGWMHLQQGRDDSVGDLARLAATNGDFPAGYRGYKAWKEHLEAQSFDARVFWALQKAWRDYGGRE